VFVRPPGKLLVVKPKQATRTRRCSTGTGEVGTETRQRSARKICVRVSAAERAQLEATAAACSCSVSALLRSTALGHPVSSTVDAQAITELSRLRGDLGRVGGLLKLRLAAESDSTDRGERAGIYDLLDQLVALQARIKERIEAL